MLDKFKSFISPNKESSLLDNIKNLQDLKILWQQNQFFQF